MSDLIPPDLTASDRAALGWFVLAWLGHGFGPGAFALATAGIVATLLRRRFGSEAAEATWLGHAVLCDDAADSARHCAPVARGTPAGRGA